MENQVNDGNRSLSFQQKLGLTALLVILILVLKATFNILLMVLAATLIALYFHGFAGLIARNLKLSGRWSMALSVIVTVLLIILLFWLIGTKVQAQIQELSDKFPSMVEQARSQLNKSPIGQKILDQASGSDGQKLSSSVKRFFSSTFGVLGDLYAILFLGIFITVGAKQYKEGIIALIPRKNKDQGRKVLNLLGHNLKSWLKGKLFAMLVVAVLTATGLFIIGLPLVFTLSIIAGVLNFIPNFGPLMAMIPAVLVGLSQGSETAMLVAGLYILVQILESNLITPMVQKKLVSIPPAMIIFGQLVIGSLTGYLGIILATPLGLIIMVLVKELYVRKVD